MDSKKTSKLFAVVVVLLIGGLIAYVSNIFDIVAGVFIVVVMSVIIVEIMGQKEHVDESEAVWRDGMINLTGNPHISKFKRLRDDFWESDEGIIVRERSIEFLDEG